jgi:hypothetical protein
MGRPAVACDEMCRLGCCRCEACQRGDADASGDAAQVGVRCPSEGCSGAVVLSREAAQLTSLHGIPVNWRPELCTRWASLLRHICTKQLDHEKHAVCVCSSMIISSRPSSASHHLQAGVTRSCLRDAGVHYYPSCRRPAGCSTRHPRLQTPPRQLQLCANACRCVGDWVQPYSPCLVNA